MSFCLVNLLNLSLVNTVPLSVNNISGNPCVAKIGQSWSVANVEVALFVTGFWKTDQIVTLGLFHFIGSANGYTCTLHINSVITGLGWLVCFSRATFADPVNLWLRQWDPWRAPHGRHECEIHPSNRKTSTNAIQACVGLWLAFLGPIASQMVLTEGLTRFRLSTHPFYLLLPPIMCQLW